MKRPIIAGLILLNSIGLSAFAGVVKNPANLVFTATNSIDVFEPSVKPEFMPAYLTLTNCQPYKGTFSFQEFACTISSAYAGPKSTLIPFAYGAIWYYLDPSNTNSTKLQITDDKVNGQLAGRYPEDQKPMVCTGKVYCPLIFKQGDLVAVAIVPASS